MAEWSSRYAYTEPNVNDSAPTTGGVYRLIYKSGESYHVFYVGQTTDLQRRLLEHLGPSEQDACIKRHLSEYSCYFRFLKVALQSDRERIEKEQIREYSPPCNG